MACVTCVSVLRLGAHSTGDAVHGRGGNPLRVLEECDGAHITGRSNPPAASSRADVTCMRLARRTGRPYPGRSPAPAAHRDVPPVSTPLASGDQVQCTLRCRSQPPQTRCASGSCSSWLAQERSSCNPHSGAPASARQRHQVAAHLIGHDAHAQCVQRRGTRRDRATPPRSRRGGSPAARRATPYRGWRGARRRGSASSSACARSAPKDKPQLGALARRGARNPRAGYAARCATSAVASPIDCATGRNSAAAMVPRSGCSQLT